MASDHLQEETTQRCSYIEVRGCQFETWRTSRADIDSHELCKTTSNAGSIKTPRSICSDAGSQIVHEFALRTFKLRPKPLVSPAEVCGDHVVSTDHFSSRGASPTLATCGCATATPCGGTSGCASPRVGWRTS